MDVFKKILELLETLSEEYNKFNLWHFDQFVDFSNFAVDFFLKVGASASLEDPPGYVILSLSFLTVGHWKVTHKKARLFQSVILLYFDPELYTLKPTPSKTHP